MSTSTIEEWAFYNCMKLRSISITSVESITKNAFRDCPVLESVKLSSSVTSIGNNAFGCCTELKSVIIPDSVSSIGESAFNGCSKLNELTVPANIDCVGSNKSPIFAGCENINKITFTGTGQWYEYGTTSDQSSYYEYTPWQLSKSVLTSITLSDKLESIGDYAFKGCDNVTSLTVPDSISSIGKGAFESCTKLNKLSIPAGLNCVGDNETPVFSGCENVGEVTFTGKGQWFDYSSTKGDSPYYGYTPWQLSRSVLSSVSISNDITTIDDWAFQGCCKLTSLTLPEQLKSIGEGTFYNCSALSLMKIPSLVSSIGTNAFDGCTSLGSFEVSSTNDHYVVESGVLFQNKMSVLIKYPEGKKDETSYKIPTTVERIGEHAFFNCKSLTMIIIQEKVQTIDGSAFEGCTELTELTVSANIDCVGSIDSPIFAGCLNIHKVIFVGTGEWYNYTSSNYMFTPWQLSKEALDTVIISSGTTSIGYRAFNNCTELTEIDIPDSVKKIEDYAFENCSSLESLSFGDSLEMIGTGAFSNCDKVESLTIPSKVKKIGDLAFRDCQALTELNLNDSLNTIGDEAFESCVSLNTVIVPDSVTYLGKSAFKNCNEVVELSIPASLNCVMSNDSPAFGGCNKIGKITFTAGSGTWYQYGSSSSQDSYYQYTPWQLCRFTLSSVTISDGVESIGVNAFKDCVFTSIIIPDTVNTIEASSFENCTKLSTLKLSESLGTIARSAFKECTALENVSFFNHLNSIGDSAFQGCIKIASLILPDSIETLGDHAFKDCKGLKSLSVPANLNCVGNNEAPIFSGCSNIEKITFTGTENWYKYGPTESQDSFYGYAPWQLCRSTLSVVVISEGVTSIGDEAFRGCSKITDIAIPSTIGLIGKHVFWDCTHLTDIRVDPNNLNFKSVSGVLLDTKTNTLIQYPEGKKDSSYSIPESAQYIGEYAFRNCIALSKVIINDSIKSIGNSAFENCTGLTELTIPIGLDCVGSVGAPIFSNCENITKITFTGSGEWHTYDTDEFRYTPWQLTKVSLTLILSDEVNSVGDGVFYKCTSLHSIAFGKLISSIGTSAFEECASLTDLYLPEFLCTIKDRAFYGCDKLQTVKLGEKITEIGESSFADCTSIQTLTIPDSVRSIGASAFSNCKGLKQLTVPVTLDSVSSLESPAFAGCTNIEKVTFNGSGKWYLYDSSKFFLTPWQISRGSLTTIVISDGVTTIGDSAFNDCNKLSSVKLSEGLLSIGNSTFANCGSLKSVNLCDALTTIGKDAFKGCTALNLSVIPASVLKIGTSAFENCSSMNSLTLSNSSLSIGDSAFKNCTDLRDLTIPVELDCVGSNRSPIFSGCINIKNITFTGSGDWHDYTPNYEYTPWHLTTVALSVVLSDEVTFVGNKVFLNCTTLTSVKLGISVTSIEEQAFDGCSALAEITVAEGNEKFSSENGKLFNHDKTTLILFPEGCEVTSYIIPDSVTMIEKYAFKDCIYLVSITIPSTVTSIGKSAFINCQGLRVLTVPAGIDCVGNNESPIFSGCSNIENITFIGTGDWYPYDTSSSKDHYYGYTPWQLSRSVLSTISISDSITSIGNSAFQDCSEVVVVSLGGSLLSIGDRAFNGCNSLLSLFIPNSVTLIGEQVFKGCNSLTSIDVDENNTKYSSIDGVLFNKDKNVLIAYPASRPNTQYKIPEQVTHICDRAFFECSNLTQVTIPSSVTLIGESAFNGTFYDTDGETILQPTADNLAGSTFMKLGDKWVKQNSPIPDIDPEERSKMQDILAIILVEIVVMASIIVYARIFVANHKFSIE